MSPGCDRRELGRWVLDDGSRLAIATNGIALEQGPNSTTQVLYSEIAFIQFPKKKKGADWIRVHLHNGKSVLIESIPTRGRFADCFSIGSFLMKASEARAFT
ncbi:MAG: hypothetical protein AAF715_11940 [Myxococcota bacterium]